MRNAIFGHDVLIVTLTFDLQIDKDPRLPRGSTAKSLRPVGEFPVELSCGMEFLDTTSCDFDH